MKNIFKKIVSGKMSCSLMVDFAENYFERNSGVQQKLKLIGESITNCI